MFTVKLIDRIRGYYRFRIAPKDVSHTADLFLQNGISVSFAADASFVVPLALRERTVSVLSEKVPYQSSELLGLPGIIYRNRRKYGVFAALAVCTLVIFLSTRIVWDIRVEGNETVSDGEILEQLDASGLRVGAAWRGLDRSRLEAAVLGASSDLSWIHVNRRGLVAYVTVAEKNWHEDGEAETRYANLVATEDAVIEEITVTRGQKTVKVGESVKAGDLLISGILPSDIGGGLCEASGTVIGRIRGEVSVFVPRTEIKTVHSDQHLCAARANIFGFSVNIFKNYGNREERCDIIEDVKNCVLFDDCRLPFSLVRSYAVEKQGVVCTYGDDELVRIASMRLNARLRVFLAESDLVSIRTEGHFTEDGYVLTSTVVALRPIGTLKYLNVEE